MYFLDIFPLHLWALPHLQVGFREYIFSSAAGALGKFAAATEYAFGTISQRIVSRGRGGGGGRGACANVSPASTTAPSPYPYR